MFHGSPNGTELIHPQISVTSNLTDSTHTEADTLKSSNGYSFALNWKKDPLADNYIIQYTQDTNTIGINGESRKVQYISMDTVAATELSYIAEIAPDSAKKIMQLVVLSNRVNAKKEFGKGIEFAGLTFSFQNLITFLFALALPFLARKFTNRITHMICLAIGGISLLSFGWVSQSETPQLLFLVMAGVGIAWSSIVSMPYSMLSGIIPENKIGIYMGIFNFFIVLPEIIASLFFGKVMKYVLNNNEVHAVMVGGGLLLLASLLCLRIGKTEKS